jgi:hypothetical protein
MADLSIQMINSIEGHRAWVSDKTLIALSRALGVEAFQLLAPPAKSKQQERRPLPSHKLLKLRQEIKANINADVDKHFERFLNVNDE